MKRESKGNRKPQETENSRSTIGNILVKGGITMAKIIMGIKLNQRNETAKALQDILTRHGCIINTRLGFHEVSDVSCSEQGYILLEFANNSDTEVLEMQKEMEALGELTVKTMEL